ncbi:MAG: tetratricopeptide repeat protein [Thermodesulfobacteriota bacterium]
MAPTKRNVLIACLVLLAAIAAIYLQTGSFDFLVYDDDDYVYNNPAVRNGLSPAGVAWAFTRAHAANYHPLTWISHMADCSLFGLAPGPAHLVNVLLHGGNALLLFLLLFRCTGSFWPALLAVVLFALHPLRVEVVAWVAERKELLANLFGLLAMLGYGQWVRHGGGRWYLAAVFFFALGLLAKPVLVSLPLLLLLLDHWPLARPAGGRVAVQRLVEKWPFFLLSAVSCLITLFAQNAGGAVQSLDQYPVAVRLGNAVVVVLAYLGKFFWPAGLAVIYPHPGQVPPLWLLLLSAAVLAAITVAALVARRRLPFVAVGWFWYLLSLLPVIGIVQVGYQAMADRYTYLPMIGIAVALAWALAEIPTFGRRAVAAAVVCLIPLLATLSWLQTGHWRDSFTLFNRALAVTADNFVAHNHLGIAWMEEGEYDKAEAQFRAGLAIKDDDFGAWNNLGVLALRRGDGSGAEEHCRRALAINPRFAAAHNNLGLALYLQGRYPEAAASFQTSLQLEPEDAATLDNLGGAYLAMGRNAEAAASFEQAIRIDHNFAGAWYDLGEALLQQGDRARARVMFETALEKDSSFTPARAALNKHFPEAAR